MRSSLWKRRERMEGLGRRRGWKPRKVRCSAVGWVDSIRSDQTRPQRELSTPPPQSTIPPRSVVLSQHPSLYLSPSASLWCCPLHIQAPTELPPSETRHHLYCRVLSLSAIYDRHFESRFQASHYQQQSFPRLLEICCSATWSASRLYLFTSSHIRLNRREELSADACHWLA